MGSAIISAIYLATRETKQATTRGRKGNEPAAAAVRQRGWWKQPRPGLTCHTIAGLASGHALPGRLRYLHRESCQGSGETRHRTNPAFLRAYSKRWSRGSRMNFLKRCDGLIHPSSTQSHTELASGASTPKTADSAPIHAILDYFTLPPHSFLFTLTTARLFRRGTEIQLNRHGECQFFNSATPTPLSQL